MITVCSIVLKTFIEIIPRIFVFLTAGHSEKVLLFYCITLPQISAVRLFFGASFIPAEFTDISFEVKVVLCLNFYAF